MQRHSLYRVVPVTLDTGERPSDKRRKQTRSIKPESENC